MIISNVRSIVNMFLKLTLEILGEILKLPKLPELPKYAKILYGAAALNKVQDMYRRKKEL